MAFGRETTAAFIKPLEGAIVRRFTAGSAIAVGEVVSMSSDGYIDPSDATAAANPALGIAVQAAAAAGPRLDVVVFGPVRCLIDATPGTVIYNGTTAGEPEATSGGNKTVVGVAESATVLFVRPQA